MDGPGDGTDAKGCANLVGSLAVALNHAGECVEVGVTDAPAVRVADGCCLSDDLGLTSLEREGLCQSEHLNSSASSLML